MPKIIKGIFSYDLYALTNDLPLFRAFGLIIF